MLDGQPVLLRRGVAHITFPVDLQEREIKGERSKRNIHGHASDVLSHSARLPHEGDLAEAADVLNKGKNIVILAGRRALRTRSSAAESSIRRLPWTGL